MRDLNYPKPKVKMLFIAFAVLLLPIIVVLISTRFVPPLKKQELLTTPPSTIPEIEAYLHSEEEKFKPKPGTEKWIHFPTPQKQKGKLSFVYLHGFSATRQEASPVFEKVAAQWQAPIFMTRFFGHGLGSAPLGLAKKENWIQDAMEAYQIGRSLGDEVVLTCMSTGCALGIYLAYYFPEKIKALIFLSPNFTPADARSFLALGPLGQFTTRLLIGDTREFKPANSEQAYYWTWRYPTTVVPEMITLVTSAKNLDLTQIKIPTLTLYSPFDRVISAPAIEANIPRLGSPKNKMIALVETQSHIIAGDIMNPQMNERVINEIVSFLKSI